ncbi:MAG: F0F1 ATP synthase subunit A [Chloroflexi bacterium]|nr:F0F1 ATP synthase subunit A [Chloroflexota bacterium]
MESNQNFLQSLGASLGRLAQRLWAGIDAYIKADTRRAAIIGGIIVLLVLSFIIRAPQPHVSLKAEPILAGGPSWFTNSLLTTFVVDIILLLVAFLATRNMKLVPSGLQNVMEAIIEYLYGLAESVAGRAAATYFPWAATIFLFVLVSNYTGLIPGVGSIGYYHNEAAVEHAVNADSQLAMAGGKLILAKPIAAEEATAEHAEFVPFFRAPSADLNVTFALAIATMVMVQVHGVRALGGKYFKKFWNTSGHGFMKGINIFVGILELVSELSRILSFAFRLFGNIFAGEVVLATMAFLITFLVPIPFYLLEVLVGAVQALVFAMLSLVFFSMATISHEHSEEHH